MVNSNIIVSVVICTYNRSQLLKKCLESLANQDASINYFEVIVVDNCSTDDTFQVTHDYMTHNTNFRYVKETDSGLSHARNRGWKEASGPYVAYIDDDAIALYDWISKIVDFIERQPHVGIFGGPFDSYSMVPMPAWFPPEYGSLFLGNEERPIDLGCEWIIGLNMVIRIDLFYKYGGFNTRLGMAGSKVAYGEEINLFVFMHANGVEVFYVPSIRVTHLVAEYKMRLSWLLRSGYASGSQFELTFNMDKKLYSHLSSLAIAIGWVVCELLRPVIIPVKRRLYYSLYKLFFEAGALSEHCVSFMHGKFNFR